LIVIVYLKGKEANDEKGWVLDGKMVKTGRASVQGFSETSNGLV
jgi:hypothetical protein